MEIARGCVPPPLGEAEEFALPRPISGCERKINSKTALDESIAKLYLANTNSHRERSNTFIASVKDYSISKSCTVENLCKEENKENNLNSINLM